MSKIIVHNYMFYFGGSDLCWNFSSVPKNRSDIHRFPTVHVKYNYLNQKLLKTLANVPGGCLRTEFACMQIKSKMVIFHLLLKSH